MGVVTGGGVGVGDVIGGVGQITAVMPQYPYPRQISTNLEGGELPVGGAYHQVHAVRHRERVRPVVVRHFAVVLAHRQHEAPQLVQLKPRQHRRVLVSLLVNAKEGTRSEIISRHHRAQRSYFACFVM